MRTPRFSLGALSGLFFAWGFLTCLNDILIPHLRGAFSLTYAQAALVQSAFFLAYFCSSLPAGALVGRLGYKRGIVIGLGCMATGAALFAPAAAMAAFPLFLLALFVLASGITLLQVAANPLVTLLGPADSASRRLTLTQAFNALGTTVAPAVGGSLILAGGPEVTAVIGPYLALAAALTALAVLFARLPLPSPKDAAEPLSFAAAKEALAHPTLALGVIGIFLYVGAEVAIGSFLVNFVNTTLQLAGGEREAAFYASLYWGGAMVGRFVGSVLMRWIRPGRLLMGAAGGSIALIALSLATTGHVSVYALLAVGLCNSIMFPTIFALGVRGLGPLTSVGASLMIQAIVGGAVVPLAMGLSADHFGLKAAFALPAVCYLYIAFYGWSSARRRSASDRSLAAAGHGASQSA